MTKESQSKIDHLLDKITKLEENNKQMKQNLKKEKFPDGGLVYVIEYKEGIYRIGMTGNMTKRKRIYNTHTLDSKRVVHMAEHKCPIKLETCVRALLYDFRVQDKKDFYECSLEIIKKPLLIAKEVYLVLKNKQGEN
jgi:hypothetical protein